MSDQQNELNLTIDDLKVILEGLEARDENLILKAFVDIATDGLKQAGQMLEQGKTQEEAEKFLDDLMQKAAAKAAQDLERTHTTGVAVALKLMPYGLKLKASGQSAKNGKSKLDKDIDALANLINRGIIDPKKSA